MGDSINSVDVLDASIALYALKKAQDIEKQDTLSLIDKTLKKPQEDLEKDIFPWLGQNIDERG